MNEITTQVAGEARQFADQSGEAERFVSLFGVEIADTTLENAAAWIVARARFRLTTSVGFLNAHCVNVLHRDEAYSNAVTGMNRNFADGIGMRVAARAFGFELQDNVNGTDLFPVLCREAAKSGTAIYLFGAQPGIAAAAGERMQASIPGLQIAGSHHGYIAGADAEADVIDEINASGAAIVLVAMGVPAQEIWIARNRGRISAPVVIGVGGLFDYYSGRIPRAPLPLRRLGLEWAWRLAQEPRRLARRYILGNVEFLVRLALHRVRNAADLSRQPSV